MSKCPACGSQYPERHPAMNYGGEVELCTHDFHLTPTHSNRPEYIQVVLDKRSCFAGADNERWTEGGR